MDYTAFLKRAARDLASMLWAVTLVVVAGLLALYLVRRWAGSVWNEAGRAVDEAHAKDERAAPPPQPPPKLTRVFKIESVDWKPTEELRQYTTFGWIVKAKNVSGEPRRANIEVEFLDAGGFVLETDKEFDQAFDAGEEREVRGSRMMRKEQADKVKSVNARIIAR